MANVTTFTGKVTPPFTGGVQRTLGSKVFETVSVKDFGAVGDGTTADYAAFEAAISYANANGARNGTGATASTAFTFVIPDGIYNLKAGISVDIAADNVFFMGSGFGNVTLLGENGILFPFGDGVTTVVGGGVSGVHLKYVTSPHADSIAFQLDKTARLGFFNITCYRPRKLFALGTASDKTASATFIENVTGSTDPAAGAVVFDAAHGSGLFLSRINLSADGVSFPTNATDPHPANDTTFLQLGSGSWDTVVGSDVISNRYNNGIKMAPGSGVVLNNIKFTNTYNDYNKTNGLLIDASGGGTVSSIFFNNGWFVATDGNSVNLTGSGTIRQVRFTQVTARQAGQNNWRFAGTAMSGIGVHSCIGIGANRLAGTNTGSQQDDLVILAGGVEVVGGSFGLNGQPLVGFVNQARYGVTIAADIGPYKVQSADLYGATGPQNIAPNTTGGSGRVVKGITNGTTSLAIEVAQSVTVGASPVSFPNYGPYDEYYTVSGGTVSSITIDAVSMGLTSGTFLVPRGRVMVVTYSSAPTVVRQRVL